MSIGLGIIDNNIQPHNINLSIGGVFCKKKDIQPLDLVYSLSGLLFFPFFLSLSSVVANLCSDVLRSLVLPLNGLPILEALKSDSNLGRLLFLFKLCFAFSRLCLVIIFPL